MEWQIVERIATVLSRFARRRRMAAAAPYLVLFEPLDGLPGAGWPLLALSVGIWLTRPDLQDLFDPDSPEGRKAFLFWQLEHGRREYGALREAFARPEVLALYTTELGPAPPSAPPPPQPPTGGVNLFGHLHAQLGVGEDARCAAAAMVAAHIPHVLIDAPVGADIGLEPHAFVAPIVEAPVHATNVFVMSAFETFRYFCVNGSGAWAGRRTICVWPWELPLWPETLEFCYLLADEIWAISAFVRGAFELTSPVPVVTMPSAVTIPEVSPDRVPFGLPDHAYVFVTLFDFNSGYNRKNPRAAIAAFREAFPIGESQPAADKRDVLLVVKAMRASTAPRLWEDLQRVAGGDPRICFIDESWPRSRTMALLAACDCLVSLHRAEGFGRPIAEALLLRKTVVATYWSGNLDFCACGEQLFVEARMNPVGPRDYRWGADQSWAEPDPSAAAAALREARRLGRRPAPSPGDIFAPETAGARYRARLRSLEVIEGESSSPA
jgi:hypothetical protein